MISRRRCSSCARRSTRCEPAPTPDPSDGRRRRGPGTRLRLRTEVLAGTWEALVTRPGRSRHRRRVRHASRRRGIEMRPLGDDGASSSRSRRTTRWPRRREPISDAELLRHRAVAVADSAQRLTPLTLNLLPGQDVLTVAACRPSSKRSCAAWAAASCPSRWRATHIAAGRLVVKDVQRGRAPRALALCVALPAATGRGAARPRPGWRCAGGSSSSRARPRASALLERHGRRTASVLSAIGHRSRTERAVRRPLRAVADRAAARRLAGRRAGDAGSTRARTAGAGWCASKTSTAPRCVAGRGPRDPAPARRLRSACPTSRRCGSRTRDAALRRGAATACCAAGWAYPCGCTRRDIERRAAALRRPAARATASCVYPGTCRDGLHGKPARATRVLRTRADRRDDGAARSTGTTGASARSTRTSRTTSATSCCSAPTGCGPTSSRSSSTTRRRASRDVVRGEDLADNTPRQIHLQRLLGLPTPRYLHTPLVLGADGEKLSKQNGAAAARPRAARSRPCARRARCSLWTSKAATLPGGWPKPSRAGAHAGRSNASRRRRNPTAGIMRSLALA